MRKTAILVTLLVGFTFSVSALATWRVYDNVDGKPGWNVRNGPLDGGSTVVLHVDSKRKAKKLAKDLNKIEKEDSEGED